MEYKCEVNFETAKSMWRKTIALPFVPMAGMYLIGIDNIGDAQCIMEVNWDCEKREFLIWFKEANVSDEGFAEAGWTQH